MRGGFPVGVLEGLLEGLDEGGLLVRNGRNCPRKRDVKEIVIVIVERDGV